MGALFDWDGVVIDSSRQHKASWEALAEEAGLPLPEDHFERGFGMINEQIIPDILGWSTDPMDIQKYSLRKESIYRESIRREGIQALPGVLELLDLLKDRDIPCVVASSTPKKNIEVVLDIIGVRDHFKAIVASGDVRLGKPDPEVFLVAANKIGRSPGHCVVFEDAHVGIEAGLSAGCKVVAVATTNDVADLGTADISVETLEQVDWALLTQLF